MKLSVFTDEISSTAARSIQLAAAWGITHIEVRGLDGGRFPRVNDTELANFENLFKDAGLSVSGVSPGLFKCPLADPSIDISIAELLPRTCEWAQRWGTDLVTCHGFRRNEEDQIPNSVIDHLGKMCDVASQLGCRTILENEGVCWGSTGLEAAEIIRRVGSDRLQLCWDPGNSAHAGSVCTYPDEYEQVSEFITHVHMKNYIHESNSWSLLAEPDLNWDAHLTALRDDSYDGFVVVETHTNAIVEEYGLIDQCLAPLESNTLRNIEFARAYL